MTVEFNGSRLGCECGACAPTHTFYVKELFDKPEPKPESIDMTYQGQVIRLAAELRKQFYGLDPSAALQRANEIIKASEEVDALYLTILEDDDQ